MYFESFSDQETVKLIKKRLKKEWKGHRFPCELRLYEDGSTIIVNWTDGPTTQQVDDIVSHYAGSMFDDELCERYPVYSWMCPDMTVARALSEGTVDRGGSADPFEYPKPDKLARLVRFDVDYVRTRRSVSEYLAQEAEGAGLHTEDIDAYEKPPARRRSSYLPPLIDEDPECIIEEIWIDEYSPKSFAVRGDDTAPLRRKLRHAHGRWNRKLKGGWGWIFSNKRRAEVDEIIAKAQGTWTEPETPEPIDDF